MPFDRASTENQYHNPMSSGSVDDIMTCQTPSASLAPCDGKKSINSPRKGAPMRSFDIFFVVSPNKILKKTVGVSVIWDTKVLMWRHCKGQPYTYP